MRLLLVVWMLAIANTASAQGMSYLGLCNESWNCQAMMKTWSGKEPIVTGWLEPTFAKDCKCGDTLLADSRPKIVRIHILNGPCMRNKRCGRYEPFWGYTAAKANRDVKRWAGSVVSRFERTLNKVKLRLESAKGELLCYASPCLECDLNETARRVLLSRVSAVLPNCILVDNPIGRRCIRGVVCEKHGPNPKVTKPCIVDLDGVDGRVVDVKKWVEQYAHCNLTYYWEPWMNCIRGDFIDPRQRDCQYGRRVFNAMRKLLCQFYSPLYGTC